MMLALLFLAFMETAAAQLQSVDMRVSGLECASCAESITRRLSRIRGVESAGFDAAKSIAAIKLLAENTVTLSAVRDALKGLGYTPGDAVVTVRGRVEAHGKERVLSLPHQERAFLVEGDAEAGIVTLTGAVPATKAGEADRLKPQ
jgi:copper chaperone CopZ